MVTQSTFNTVFSVSKPGTDVDDGEEDDDQHQDSRPLDGAEVPGLGGLADVDVSLNGEDKSQPDGDVVEELRNSLHKQFKCEAEGFSPIH